jgi:hypothetical protein
MALTQRELFHRLWEAFLVNAEIKLVEDLCNAFIDRYDGEMRGKTTAHQASPESECPDLMIWCGVRFGYFKTPRG